VQRTLIHIVVMMALNISLFSQAFADRVTEAKLRFEQGADYIKSNEVRKGLNELLISNRLAPNPNTLLNVARALNHLGLFEYAYLVYDEYLRDNTISDSDRESAERASKLIAREVARLNIETHPSNVQIYLNRESLGDYGTTPREVAAQGGRHLVILKAKDYMTRRIKIDLTKGISKQLSVALEPMKGTVILSTEDWATRMAVPDVTVSDLKGVVIGKSNEKIQLPVGNHTLVLTADGFSAQEISVSVSADEDANAALDDWDDDWMDDEEESQGHDATKTYQFQLEPVKGSVRILANKIGALIYLDDREVGFTPQVIDASVGTHELRLELTGYKTWSGELVVDHHKQRTVGEIEFRRPSTSKLHKGWPWGLVGLSGLSLGLSVALAIEGQSANKNLSAYPTEIEVDRGNRYLMLADGAIAVSVLSAIGSYFLFRTISEASYTQPRARFYETNTPLEALPPFEEMTVRNQGE